jgi:hypothetical protein
MRSERTEYGFTYGAAEVRRVTSDDKKGWVVIDVETSKVTLQLYVTKTGKMRVCMHGEEIALPKKESTK